jgi:hypothetical protein
MANGLNFNIGMSVPGASSLYNAPSMASQVQNETEEQRNRRLQAIAASRQLPSGSMSSLAFGYGAALNGGAM